MRAPTPGFTTRFAPAPTGALHLGHAVNALWVWGLARRYGGRVLLRIEDHDRGRCRPAYEQGILDDLDWLGLVPDDLTTADFRAGPVPQRQSDKTLRYATRLAELEMRGLVYSCTCSRAEIARATDGTAGGELVYPGTCRGQGPGVRGEGLRVIMSGDAPERFDDLRLGPQSHDPMTQCGDLLVRDRHGHWTYQFAVTVDDWEQGIDLVIRGEDLLPSTGRQLRLARLLGRTTPPAFLHHPLLRHPDGRKLSKSSHDTGLAELRAAGWTPAQVFGLAAQLSGRQPEPTPRPISSLPDLFA
ncbi:MAG: glutamate--tRNA ligase family protein [Gemmatimonadaceae bacterium]|jgi:glutamyl/glutaminyl-tRNA synthetase